MSHTIDLSVIVPSIRPGNLKCLYDSIKASAPSYSFEMIVIGPYDLPLSLRELPNVHWIQDWGCPVRAQQIGLLNTRGKYVSWAADDGVYLPGALEIALNSLKAKEKTVVVGKYYEGVGGIENPVMNKIDYYYIYTHEASRCKYIPKDCLMIMVGVVERDTLLSVGGWDSRFEVCPMAYNDLSIRLYNLEYKFLFQEETIFKCFHMPGNTGDHGPIHAAQTQHDTYIFKMIYTQPQSINRKYIPIDNWEKSPARWERRFGKK